MQDRFWGKTWVFWAQMIALGAFGCFALVFGTLFWTGAMTDAHGKSRPGAGPPMVITGAFLLLVAVLAAVNIAGRARPVIRCFREGIECSIAGATSLDGVPLLPGSVRLAWSILSLQGFRSMRLRIAWPDFRNAEVTGLPMAYVLLLHGTATNTKSGATSNQIAFRQVALVDDPRSVADMLNRFGANQSERDRLSTWGSVPGTLHGK